MFNKALLINQWLELAYGNIFCGVVYFVSQVYCSNILYSYPATACNKKEETR